MKIRFATILAIGSTAPPKTPHDLPLSLPRALRSFFVETWRWSSERAAEVGEEKSQVIQRIQVPKNLEVLYRLFVVGG